MQNRKKNRNQYVVSFQETNASMRMITGGKGANLGELFAMAELHVPDGFCITTEAYKTAIANNETLHDLFTELRCLETDDKEQISAISAKIRKVIAGLPIPNDIEEAITDGLTGFDTHTAFAIRSSATAEDLPTASFAGQQDTYLNIIDKNDILQYVSKCWASLFTDRAVMYRMQNGFDHHHVYLSVVVQKMIFPEVSGILFTADPVTSNRKILSIDAGFGLGEALVSGLVNADVYKVSNGMIINKKIAVKNRAIQPLKNGGTEQQTIIPEQQNQQALTDHEILQLEHLGRKIEAHFGCPQDIEWCLSDHVFYIVQSRPITTLFPVPQSGDPKNHVYVSVGHQQMMTDAMKPLGLSFFQLSAIRPMFDAAGRLFVDVAENMRTLQGRTMIADMLGKSDPLIKDALLTLADRDFIELLPDEASDKNDKTAPSLMSLPEVKNDPAIVADLIHQNEVSVAELQQSILTKSGAALFDFIKEDIIRLQQPLSDSKGMAVIMTAMKASWWINEKMEEWLGEKNAADTLSQSVSNNITSAMGLALMDVADVIRAYPEVIQYLQETRADDFLDNMASLQGGIESRNAIIAYLEKYGMRCAGEIDITKTRWSEKPLMLVPMLLSNIKNFEFGAGQQKFKKGLQEALNKEQELLQRLKQLPDGEQKVIDTKQKIDLLRNFIGYREYPKYGKIRRYFVYKTALLQEAEKLLAAGVIHEMEDVYYLRFDEFHECVRTHQIDYNIIYKRKEDYKLYEKLQPPRVITSDGEIITGQYKREQLPANAIVGLAVSSGIVEGRARIILHMEDANLEKEDILITTFTDPSWTPLFVSIKGLITEVGGLMTHGAVIAREYGLPAVVGVENATKLIKEGQRIRVNGTDGYVELL